MSKRTKIILIVIAVAVVGYFAWQWYQNNQSSSGSSDAGDGSNLNSAAPTLTAADEGDNSAPSYSAGTETINVTLPNGEQSTSSSSGSSGSKPTGKKPAPVGTKVSVPNVVGQTDTAAVAKLKAAGLKATAGPRVAGKTLYVTSETPKAGTKVAKGSSVKLGTEEKKA